MNQNEINIPVTTQKPIEPASPPAAPKVRPKPITGPVPLPDESILTFSPDSVAENQPNSAKKTMITAIVIGCVLLIGGGAGFYLYLNSSRINASNLFGAVSRTPIPAPKPVYR